MNNNDILQQEIHTLIDVNTKLEERNKILQARTSDNRGQRHMAEVHIAMLCKEVREFISWTEVSNLEYTIK